MYLYSFSFFRRDACLGFVIKAFGRPVLRCTVCKKFQRNLKARMDQKLKKRKYQDSKKNLTMKCCKLIRKRNSLKEEVKLTTTYLIL